MQLVERSRKRVGIPYDLNVQALGLGDQRLRVRREAGANAEIMKRSLVLLAVMSELAKRRARCRHVVAAQIQMSVKINNADGFVGMRLINP